MIYGCLTIQGYEYLTNQGLVLLDQLWFRVILQILVYGYMTNQGFAVFDRSGFRFT